MTKSEIEKIARVLGDIASKSGVSFLISITAGEGAETVSAHASSENMREAMTSMQLFDADFLPTVRDSLGEGVHSAEAVTDAYTAAARDLLKQGVN